MKPTSYFMMVTVGASASLSVLVQLADAGRIESAAANQVIRSTGVISTPTTYFRSPANLPGDTLPAAERPRVPAIKLPGADASSSSKDAIQVEVELNGERKWIVIRKKPHGLPPELTEGAVVISGTPNKREQVEYFFPGCKECGEGEFELSAPIALQELKAGSQNLRNIIVTVQADMLQKREYANKREQAVKATTCQTAADIEDPKRQMKCIAQALAALEAGKHTEAAAAKVRTLLEVFSARMKEECGVKKDRTCFELATSARLMKDDHPMRFIAEGHNLAAEAYRAAEMARKRIVELKALQEENIKEQNRRDPQTNFNARQVEIALAKKIQEDMIVELYRYTKKEISDLADYKHPLVLSEVEVRNAKNFFAAMHNSVASLSSKSIPTADQDEEQPIRAALAQREQTSQFQGMTIDPLTGAGLPGIPQQNQNYLNPNAVNNAFANNRGVVPGLGSPVNNGQFNGLSGRGVVPGLSMQPGMGQQGFIAQQPGLMGQQNIFQQQPFWFQQQNMAFNRPMGIQMGMPMMNQGFIQGFNSFQRPMNFGFQGGFNGLNNGMLLSPGMMGNSFMNNGFPGTPINTGVPTTTSPGTPVTTTGFVRGR